MSSYPLAHRIADIALGYADYSVDIVMVLNDVAWTDEDWAGIPVPVLLKRDFAVIGRAPGPDGLLVTWDSNYVSKKVRHVNVDMLTCTVCMGSHISVRGARQTRRPASGAAGATCVLWPFPVL